MSSQGAITPSSGRIRVDGAEATIAWPKDSDALGFAFIHQELALVPDFSAIDNMTLGLRSGSRLGFANVRERARISQELAERLGMSFSLRRPVRQLTIAERGLVAIGRALARDARFIAMDEPTASLSDVECSRLFRIIRELAADGVSVAYVSHRLNEIEELSDRVTVFKDGESNGGDSTEVPIPGKTSFRGSPETRRDSSSGKLSLPSPPARRSSSRPKR